MLAVSGLQQLTRVLEPSSTRNAVRPCKLLDKHLLEREETSSIPQLADWGAAGSSQPFEMPLARRLQGLGCTMQPTCRTPLYRQHHCRLEVNLSVQRGDCVLCAPFAIHEIHAPL